MNKNNATRQEITSYLALGSNLGNREQYIEKAISHLAKEIKILEISPIYETAPWGILEQGKFLNLCLKVSTSLSPLSLLSLCQAVEQKLGRRVKNHWGPREIDIDILFYNSEIIHSENLTVPHPELVNRQFVLKPLSDIAKDFIHPEHQISIQDLSDQLSMEGIEFYCNLNENKINGDTQPH